MTRAQKKRQEQRINALRVPEQSCKKKIDITIPKKTHLEDESFGKLWGYASEEEQRESRNGASYKHEVQKEVLYQIFEPNKGVIDQEIKQIVVPKTLLELFFSSRLLRTSSQNLCVI